MDIIKFRFWHIPEKEMISNEKINKNHAYRYLINGANERDYIIPMQYTGKNDVNGDEIYVGDIMGNGVLTCVVEKKEDGAYILRFVSPKMKGITISILDTKVTNSEIVGNIYENSELLAKLK